VHKPFLVMVGNKIWDRKQTKHFAEKLIRELNDKWVSMGSSTRAVLAYDIEGKGAN